MIYRDMSSLGTEYFLLISMMVGSKPKALLMVGKPSITELSPSPFCLKQQQHKQKRPIKQTT